MTTIGEATSRLRNIFKAVKEDPFLTDRFLYSLISKYGKMLLKRQDNEYKIMKYNSLFKVLPCIDLIEVDKVEACCIGIRTGCTFRRSKDKLPALMEGSKGPLIRAVTTLDISEELQSTYPTLYANMTKSTYFKYNKTMYYWFIDGHIYVPNADLEGVRLEAMFDQNIESFSCSESDDCTPAQERDSGFPDWFFAEIEQTIEKEVLTSGQIPSDGPDDSQNILR